MDVKRTCALQGEVVVFYFLNHNAFFFWSGGTKGSNYVEHNIVRHDPYTTRGRVN